MVKEIMCGKKKKKLCAKKLKEPCCGCDVYESDSSPFLFEQSDRSQKCLISF